MSLTLGHPELTARRADVVNSPDVTITVVSWNTRSLLRECLLSLASAARTLSVEIHVVDNASTDGSVDLVRNEFPDVHLFAGQENLGFARANNLSWAKATGRYWMLLNSDTRIVPGAIDRLVAFADAHPRAGLVSAKLVNVDGTPQHCAQPAPSAGLVLLEASRLPRLLPARLRGRLLLGPHFEYDRPVRVGWTWGTALLARRETVSQAGPIDDRFFMYGEDLEWCLRVREYGWEVWFCPQAEVVHLGGQSAELRWGQGEKQVIVLDAINRAIQLRRGGPFAWRMRAASLFALGIERIAALLQGRDTARLDTLIGYYRKRLMR